MADKILHTRVEANGAEQRTRSVLISAIGFNSQSECLDQLILALRTHSVAFFLTFLLNGSTSIACHALLPILAETKNRQWLN